MIQNSLPRLHTGTGAVVRAFQMVKIMIIADLEDKIGFTGNLNLALTVMGFTVHTALKVSPFELHRGRKPGTELTNIFKDKKSYLSV